MPRIRFVQQWVDKRLRQGLAETGDESQQLEPNSDYKLALIASAWGAPGAGAGIAHSIPTPA
jgi:hypothetical protein